MKKATLFFILTLVIVVCSVGWSGGVAFAAVSEPECDEVFKSTMEELLTVENAGDTYVESRKTLLYDLELEPFGYLYSFTANGESGFAIIVNSNGFYECVEVYFDAISPYASAAESDLCVYVNLSTYWKYKDGIYYDLRTNEEIPVFIVDSARKKAYMATPSPTPAVNEVIYYTYRSENKYQMVNRHPFMFAKVASCVPTMGGNIIQYYDRFCENLIPNYVPGRTIHTIYRYKDASDETEQVVRQLASDMGTVSTGTTVKGFTDGMKKYCNDRNYTFSYTICMDNDQFNYSFAKQQIESGKPIALFVDPYSIETIYIYDGSDAIEHWYSDVPHSMAMFGYREITYTLSNGQTRTDEYLKVATGNVYYPDGYCKISNKTTIDQALAIAIS